MRTENCGRELANILIHLDTNFLISLLHSGSSEDRRIRSARRDGEAINISVMAWAEFLSGPVNADELSIAKALLPYPEILVAEDAVLAGELYNQTGRRRGSLGDCLIAACCIRVGAQLATNNLADFRAFENAGLQILPVQFIQ
jgi:predicted nucleic acid-binding protein